MDTGNEQIKLVIWDLDDTLWDGTLAEGGNVAIPSENISIIKTLTERGIINSICSKNNFDAARKVLQDAGIWEFFVFAHIAFTPKGEAINHIITNMQLRAPNVLFIDDSQMNLEEARFYNQGIQTLNARELGRLLRISEVVGKPDAEHKRLKQYKMLETRYEASQESGRNDMFLRDSDIHVTIVPTTPDDAERVHDMIMRTNQLNFTKKRISIDEVNMLLRDSSIQSATVRVRDRFGDNGVVGWYCLKDAELLHFLFSCRIINLGIEQYVYSLLGFPNLMVVGDTASTVSKHDKVPDYITLDKEQMSIAPLSYTAVEKLQIYGLGACDLQYVVDRMALPLTNIHYEHNTFKGNCRIVNVATEYIRSCFEMSDMEKEFCRAHFHNYIGRTAFNTRIFDDVFDYVFLSFHDDFVFDIYQHKDFDQLRVVLSDDKHGSFTPILHPEGIEDFDDKKWLAENFDKVGLISQERFLENLNWIEQRLSKKTHMILLTGPEFDYFRNAEPSRPSFRDQVSKLNIVIRDFCSKNSRVSLVETNDVIFSREHFRDYIMHLEPRRAYLLTLKILENMAAMPSDKALKKFIPIRDRRMALWSSQHTSYPNYLTLCAVGAKPDDVIAEQSHVDWIESVIPQSLNGKSDKYFVLLMPDKDLEERKSLLDSYGFKMGTDYVVLEQTPVIFSIFE